MNILFARRFLGSAVCGRVALLALGLNNAAFAGETPTAPPLTAPSSITVPGAKSPFGASPVSQRLLASSRAGSASAVVTESGSLQQTTATNVQTGTNAIGGGSFANALGLTTVIQNSGANVLIQNATTINVQFK